jgi:molybdopterin-synthase adenylyltransferase
MDSEQLRRYARHLVLPQIGEAGQARLLAASVLVIGAGGLGSNALASLCAAGVGRLGIVEPDRVELSNLQRQMLYETSDIGRLKAIAARDRLEEMNPSSNIEIFQTRLDENNARALVKDFDIVLDGSDNFATRFAINAACFAEHKTLISAAISGFLGQLSTFKGAPCYRCFVPDIPPREIDCKQEGIIGPLASMMGNMQALEAIKEILGIGESLSGYVVTFDALTQTTKKITLKSDPTCPVCAGH